MMITANQRPRSAYRTALILAPDPERSAAPAAFDTDGEVPAEQIARTWDLDVDLVVLSACESGLGKQAGGEGILWFAQPLLARGARSLVLSLWKVDDRATALMMARFYRLPADTSAPPARSPWPASKSRTPGSASGSYTSSSARAAAAVDPAPPPIILDPVTGGVRARHVEFEAVGDRREDPRHLGVLVRIEPIDRDQQEFMIGGRHALQFLAERHGSQIG
jgi:hypothetical protein